MPRDPNAPNPMDTLDDILFEDEKKDDPARQIVWQTKFGKLTRGDLMRLAGWSPADLPVNYDGGPFTSPGDPRPTLSGQLKTLSVNDFQTLALVLQKHNSMSYGTSAYFCCTCV